MEARIYAENPNNNFLPDTGKLYFYKYPPNNPNLRVETGVQQGDEISIHYDPMIAKVVVKGRDRDEAIKRLDSALKELQVVGVTTNVPFIRKILGIEEFSAGNVDTGFIGVNREKVDDI